VATSYRIWVVQHSLSNKDVKIWSPKGIYEESELTLMCELYGVSAWQYSYRHIKNENSISQIQALHLVMCSFCNYIYDIGRTNVYVRKY
jgi:hypothetical protein